MELTQTRLKADPLRVEAVMIQNHNLNKLIITFKTADKNDFFQVLTQFGQIIQHSKRINQALGRSGSFMEEFVSRLRKNKARIQKPMLQILRLMFEQSSAPKTFGIKQKLDEVLEQLSMNVKFPIIQELALRLLQDFRKS
jgi:hypothetical protein